MRGRAHREDFSAEYPSRVTPAMRSRSSKPWKRLRPFVCLFWKELLGGSCPHLSLSLRPIYCWSPVFLPPIRSHISRYSVHISNKITTYYSSLLQSYTVQIEHNKTRGGRRNRKSQSSIALKTCLSWERYSTCYHSLGTLYHRITNHVLFLVSTDSPHAHTNSRLTNYE